MRALVSILFLVCFVTAQAASLPVQLVNAAKVLERSAAESLTVAHTLFDNSSDTQSAWVLMRDVATFRSQSATLVHLLSGPTPHVDVARKTLTSMADISKRVDAFLADPESGPEDDVLALLAAWTKTNDELARVNAMMTPPPPVPPQN